VIDGDNIYYVTGDNNHQELMSFLANRMKVESIYHFTNIHNLWYRWHRNVLQFCGADTESKDELEKFENYVENNKSLILKKLRNLY
jgi:hypothetical protein